MTSWSLFEAVASGTPVLTNQSEATTGTIPINSDYIIPSIDTLSDEASIHKVHHLLTQKKPKPCQFDQKFSKDVACRSWQTLINQCLKNRS